MVNILHTHQLSGAVIDIIERSKEYCYLVTPYLRTWPLLERALDKASQQKKRLTIVLRNVDGTANRIEGLHKRYGFEIIVLDDLHAKLYCSESSVLVASMNLYDSSQAKNLEVGLLLENNRDAYTFYQEFVLKDLLATPHRKHYKGYWHSDDQNLAEEMRRLESTFAEKGFCVSCGTRIDLDKGKQNWHPEIVRCPPCFQKEPYPDGYSLTTRFCHYCGEDFQSNLTKPLHAKCQELLHRYCKWERTGRGEGKAAR
jgi:hypothetical protein